MGAAPALWLMSSQEEHEVLILAFGELTDDDWEEIVELEVFRLRDALDDAENRKYQASVEAREIGKGADWLALGLYFVMAALVIPATHKKVREYVEEWQRIYKELHAFFSRVVGDRPALYPDAYLFLAAVGHLARNYNIDQLEYKSFMRLPEQNPSLLGHEALLFSFSSSSVLVQVAVSRSGEIAWENEVLLWHGKA